MCPHFTRHQIDQLQSRLVILHAQQCTILIGMIWGLRCNHDFMKLCSLSTNLFFLLCCGWPNCCLHDVHRQWMDGGRNKCRTSECLNIIIKKSLIMLLLPGMNTALQESDIHKLSGNVFSIHILYLVWLVYLVCDVWSSGYLLQWTQLIGFFLLAFLYILLYLYIFKVAWGNQSSFHIVL